MGDGLTLGLTDRVIAVELEVSAILRLRPAWPGPWAVGPQPKCCNLQIPGFSLGIPFYLRVEELVVLKHPHARDVPLPGANVVQVLRRRPDAIPWTSMTERLLLMIKDCIFNPPLTGQGPQNTGKRNKT